LSQTIEDSGPRPLEGALILKEIVVPVCFMTEGVKLKSKLRRIDASVELPERLGIPSFAFNRVKPRLRERGYEVANLPGPAIELDCAGHEEAAAPENTAADIREPFVEHSQKPHESALAFERAVYDFANENIASLAYGRELQLLLRSEVRKETALAQVEIVRKPPNSQALKPLGRSNVHRGLQNALPGLLASRLARPFLSDFVYRFHSTPRKHDRSLYTTRTIVLST
jgi:hypothetical protein